MGVARASRDEDGVVRAGKRLHEALGTIKPTARAVLDAVRDMAPDTKEVEFGIKLTAEAGALIAKAAGEGHFTVKLTWTGEGSSG